jgi:hypothetical protein
VNVAYVRVCVGTDMSLADALGTYSRPAPPPQFPVIDPTLLGDSQYADIQQGEGSQEETELKEEVEDQEMGDLFGDEACVVSLSFVNLETEMSTILVPEHLSQVKQ